MGETIDDSHIPTEIASKVGLTRKRIDTARKASSTTIPFSAYGENNKVSHVTPYDEAVANEELEARKEQFTLLYRVLRRIPSVEALVIRKRFLEYVSLSYRQLGDYLKCSHETVRKIERKGLDRLHSLLS